MNTFKRRQHPSPTDDDGVGAILADFSCPLESGGHQFFVRYDGIDNTPLVHFLC